MTKKVIKYAVILKTGAQKAIVYATFPTRAQAEQEVKILETIKAQSSWYDGTKISIKEIKQ